MTCPLQIYYGQKNVYSSIQDSVEFLNKKYGSEYAGLNVLAKYYETQNPLVLTKDNNIRNTISSFNPFEIRNYLDKKMYEINYSSNADQYLQQVSKNIELALSAKQYAVQYKSYVDAQNYYGKLSSKTGQEVLNILSSSNHEIKNNNLGSTRYIDWVYSKLSKSSQVEFLNYVNGQYQSDFYKNLTVDEAIAIYNYTCGSGPIQKYLGTGNFIPNKFSQSGIPSKVQADLNVLNLDSALEKGPELLHNQVFFRGDSFSNADLWGLPELKTNPAQVVGKTITVDNYISSGISMDGAFDGEILYEITAPKGSKVGAYINEVSAYMKSNIEYEFLIKRKAKLKINNYKYLPNGKLKVYAEIVGFDSY